MSPKVKGLILPNNSELRNIQFVDDTSIFVELEEENINNLMKKFEFFCLSFGARVSKARSILLG